MNTKERLRIILKQGGITINGDKPTDIKVNNETLYDRIFKGGSIAVGESYMDGWWDCKDLAGFFFRVFRYGIAAKIANAVLPFNYVSLLISNQQSRKKAREAVKKIYDMDAGLYSAMLGPSMAYTCGYWKSARSLGEAQMAKFDLICRKLRLRYGDQMLDIGCGWGKFLAFAAKKYGVRGVGITVSKEQAAFAREAVRSLNVEVRLEDYRDMDGIFDHVVSVGMFEHVGPKNYRAYFEKVSELLRDKGLFLLHTIGTLKASPVGEPWVNKYIFPNAVLPTMEQIAKASSGLFVMEDVHNFGTDYSKTLVAWYENFVRAWPELRDRFDDRFFRMWRFYLLSHAGVFKARHTQVWQIVFSKKGVLGGYNSIR